MSRNIGLACVTLWVFCAGIVAVASGVEPTKKFTETITAKDGSRLSLDMVLIPGGTFTMGSPAGEPGRAEHEGPQRQIQVKPFYLCTTETTIELFL
ncbi:MAG TPA: SUMF1/EgtB/PvdO family nonheme iron enzyme, partial [Sedimentisphaerales bacterium]|nr:SUMF1/EgtB/PvdO family nonheme iron enzyme [Sedimentisphaerales bacterium]